MTFRRTIRLALAAGAALAAGPLAAQQTPADLTTIPPVATDYQPNKTASWQKLGNGVRSTSG